jgi:iron complex outermembrane receptor protein
MHGARFDCAFRFGITILLAMFVCSGNAFAQRAHENVVTEASDAFGLAVGREEIGLYTSSSARGFNPSEAGNLRIDGLYFDQVSKLATHIMRGSSVHVGISAQGFPFPAPTGVVDFHPRVPGGEVMGSALVGYESYGDQAYGEVDFQIPVIADTLSFGGGLGYARNSSYNIAARTNDWTVGGIVRWQPASSLVITPFWSMSKHMEEGEKQHVFIGDSGFPRFRGVDLMAQPWADYAVRSRNFGGTARYSFGDSWQLAAGMFRSQSSSPLNYDPLLLNTNSVGEGDYFISAVPPRSDGSTSGEIRLSKEISTETVRNTFHVSVKGRDRGRESGGADTIGFGPGTTSAIPLIAPPAFDPGLTTVVEARQLTPGVAYEGVWRNVGQISLGVQKSSYHRTITAPDVPSISGSSTPWLFNVGAAAFLTRKLVAYASFTRGFEEIGTAPINAVNHGEAVPAQLTEQVDAGIKYELLPGLQLVAGIFEIKKPYFDLDQANVFRRVGSTSNLGAELSLAGNVTDRLTIVAGITAIDPEVQFEVDGSGSTSAVAIGPVPGLFRANFQYRSASISGLTFDAEIESLSRRYARADSVRLPAVTTIDVGMRYDTQVVGRNATLRFQVANLTDEFGLTPNASGKITPFDARSFELSLAFDI